MAITDRQILGSGTKAAPLDYTLPPSVALRLKAVEALFTDNGAAVDWLPAVVILSDSGNVIARAVDQSVKVTAGDDAEVSWFPGVKHAGGASTVTVAQPFVSQARTTLQTITSGVVTALAPNVFTQAQGYVPGTFATGGLPSGTLTFSD